MTKAVILYMPVIHKGYIEFLQRHASLDATCLLIGRNALSILGPRVEYILRKDASIRALPDEMVHTFVSGLGLFRTVRFVEQLDIGDSLYSRDELVGPDEDVTHLAAGYFFPNVHLCTKDKVRLRYDRNGVQRVDPVPASNVTLEEANRFLMLRVQKVAERSIDWWLSVGALITQNGEVLFEAYNTAQPHPETKGVLGDPRSQVRRGEENDLTIDFHAERNLVAQAARAGTSLLGTDAYVTHFPCLICAASLAEAGVRRLFFRHGYSRLESVEVFKAHNTELIRVIFPED